MALPCLSAQAGQIISLTLGEGDISFVPPGIPPGPLNNNGTETIPDPSNESLIAGIAPIVSWTSTAPVVLLADVRNTDGITEYYISLNFDNDTPDVWTKLIVELGSYSPTTGFLPGAFAELDFDTSPTDLPGIFTPSYSLFNDFDVFVDFYFFDPPRPQVWTADRIEIIPGQYLDDAIEPFTYGHNLQFGIDVPDAPASGPWLVGPEDYQFALRFTPAAVPEPGTLGLLAAAGLGVLGRRRRD